MQYVNMRAKHFAQYTTNHFNPDHFVVLSRFLEKEQVSPASYFDFVMGMLDYKKAPTPKSLANPELLQRYRNTVKEANNVLES